jgi:phosphatidylserine/phosphatidylglycerophosphate/cardiolipin synthase-like enzyme
MNRNVSAVILLLIVTVVFSQQVMGDDGSSNRSGDLVAGENMRILRGADYRTHFWENLKEAKKRVWISTYSISGPRSRMMDGFYRKMSEKAETEGVDVRLLLPGKLDSSHEVAAKLRAKYKFKVRLYKGNGLLHSKYILLDDKQIYNGSANLTLTAFNREYETSIYFESEKLFPKFQKHYQRLWELAH